MKSEKRLTGRVYDIQGFSVQDGPGIRTTVFLKGCPLRCPWCHSPESQSFAPQVCWIAMRCTGISACGRCLDTCTRGALKPGRMTQDPAAGTDIQLVHIDRTLCDHCGACAAACYPTALYICGTDYTVDTLLERLCRDRPFYEHSGGGVTISGGEPLSQSDFTLALLKGLKERGIHTALDTTGYTATDHILAALPDTDLFLYDLKHMDSAKHQAVVGVPNELILKNAVAVAAGGGKIQVRIPVIPQFNDDEKNIRAAGLFCRELGASVTSVQLLPYHNLGVVKYQRIDEDCPGMETVPPSEEQMARLKSILEEYHLPVSIH